MKLRKCDKGKLDKGVQLDACALHKIASRTICLSDVPHFSGAIWPPVLLWSGWVRVARGGDTEEFEDLGLEWAEFWLKGLYVFAIVFEFVAGDVAEDLEDAFG